MADEWCVFSDRRQPSPQPTDGAVEGSALEVAMAARAPEVRQRMSPGVQAPISSPGASAMLATSHSPGLAYSPGYYAQGGPPMGYVQGQVPVTGPMLGQPGWGQPQYSTAPLPPYPQQGMYPGAYQGGYQAGYVPQQGYAYPQSPHQTYRMPVIMEQQVQRMLRPGLVGPPMQGSPGQVLPNPQVPPRMDVPAMSPKTGETAME
jgi:hypothetical protein